MSPPYEASLLTVTRYILIRNDQRTGSTHRAKNFIAAGNRPMTPRWPQGPPIRCVIMPRASTFSNIKMAPARSGCPGGAVRAAAFGRPAHVKTRTVRETCSRSFPGTARTRVRFLPRRRGPRSGGCSRRRCRRCRAGRRRAGQRVLTPRSLAKSGTLMAVQCEPPASASTAPVQSGPAASPLVVPRSPAACSSARSPLRCWRRPSAACPGGSCRCPAARRSRCWSSSGSPRPSGSSRSLDSGDERDTRL